MKKDIGPDVFEATTMQQRMKFPLAVLTLGDSDGRA